MPNDDIGLGLVLNVAFWAAVIGGISVMCLWALTEYGPAARKLRDTRMKRRAKAPASGTVGGSIEKQERIGEAERNRQDRAA